MAIRNLLTNELNTINDRIRNRQDMGGLVNDQLFGLLNNQTNNRIIIDPTVVTYLENIRTNADYTVEIGNLQQQFNTRNNNIQDIDRQIQQVRIDRERYLNNIATAIINHNQNQQRAQLEGYIRQEEQLQNQRNAELQQRDQIHTNLNALTTVRNTYRPMIQSRRDEITTIVNIANTFTNNTIPAQVLGYNASMGMPLLLNTYFSNNANIRYEICDPNTGEPLTRQNNGIQTTIGGQTITIRGITIDTTNNELNIQNIQIDPITGLNFPLTLQIAVRGRIQEENITGINLDNYKTLNLTINAPQLELPERQQAYENLNQNNTVNTRLTAEYSDPTRTNIENEVIWDIMRANGNQMEIDQIYNNEQQRNLLIQRIRSIPNLIPVFTTQQLQNGFRNEMTRIDRDVSMQYLMNQNTFTDYLRLNLSDNMKKYVKDQIKNGINTTTHRNNILRTVMDFQSDISNDKLDNDDHTTLDQNIPNIRPQGHPNSRYQRLLRKRSKKNNRTKFFDGRESKALSDSIETNEGKLEFDIQVSVHGVNKIVTTINIKGEDEPIILDTKDVNEMTHMILRLEATKTGEPISRKLRCRMALNAVKAVVSMSPVTLHRQYQGNITAIDGNQYQIDRISTHIRGDNLVLRGSCAASHVNRQRRNYVIFDEKRYKGLHNINELERGMVGLSQQINDIMNAMGNEFREATSRIKAKPLMRYNTRKYLRGGPIKRLRARIVYGKTNRNFDFDTTANSGKKSVNIKFEKGKFTLSGTFKEKPYEFKGRNLGSILRKKKDRLRVFDGLELSIFEKINEAMIEKLRTNNIIGSENFAVSDLNQDKTGRVFFLDSNGDLSYIEIEDRNLNPLNSRKCGRIDFNNLPPQRIRCNETERREFMQNPLLSGRLLRAMRRRLSF